MARLVGVSKQQLYRKFYADAMAQIRDLTDGRKKQIDALITQYNDEQEKAAKWGRWLSPLFPVFSIVRGLFESFEDVNLGFNAAVNSFINNVSHVFDESDGYDWKTDLKYLFVDGISTIAEGFYASSIGIATDLISLFGDGSDPKSFVGKLRNSVYGENGIIQETNEYFNAQRASVLRKEGIGRPLFEILKNKDTLYSKQQTQKDLAIISGNRNLPEADKRIIEERWTSDESQLTSDENDYKFASDEKRYQIYKEIYNDIEKNVTRKEVIKRLTLQKQFDAAFASEQTSPIIKKGYEFVDSVTENVGRMIPVIGLAYFGSGIGASVGSIAPIGAGLSTAYFGGSVFGQSLEQAIGQGATLDDAYTFATGNMMLEMATEQLGGFELGKIPFGNKNLWNVALNEAMEEGIAELAQTGLSYYGNKNNAIPDAEETASSLWKRVGYSMAVGAASGILMKSFNDVVIKHNGPANFQASGKNLSFLLEESENKIGSERTQKAVAENISKAEKILNSDKYLPEQKEAMLNDSVFSDYFTRTKRVIDVGNGETTERVYYKLNKQGEMLSQGKIYQEQDGKLITKETHAVGVVKPLQRFDQTVAGETVKIAEKKDIKSKNLLNVIDWAQRENVPVAFVEISQKNKNIKINSYVSFKNGVIYVPATEKGVLDFLAHEIHDKIHGLLVAGLLSKAGYKSYIRFIDMLVESKIVESIPEEYFKEIQRAYSEVAEEQGITDEAAKKEMISRETVSFLIQDVLKNGEVLARAFNKNQSLFRRVANIFTKKNNLNTLEIETKFKNLPIGKKVINKLSKAFSKVLETNKEAVIVTTNFNSKSVVDAFFHQGIKNDTAFRNAFSLNIPDFMGDKESIINKILGKENNKKIVFHRSYQDEYAFLETFKEGKGDAFASMFVSDYDFFNVLKSMAYGKVVVTLKKEVFDIRDKRRFAFLPAETRSVLRKIYPDENKIFLSSSWFSYRREFNIKKALIYYDEWAKNRKHETNKIQTYQTAIIYQSVLVPIYDSDPVLTMNEVFNNNPSEWGPLLFTPDPVVNLINTFRKPEKVSLNEIKNYTEAKSQNISPKTFLEHKRTVEELSKSFAECGFLLPRDIVFPEYYYIREFGQDFYGQILFWKFLAKIADGTSLENDSFLNNLHSGYYRNHNYTEETIVSAAKDFVFSSFVLTPGIYYEVKTDILLEDIDTVFVFAESGEIQDEKFYDLKQFLNSKNIRLISVYHPSPQMFKTFLRPSDAFSIKKNNVDIEKVTKTITDVKTLLKNYKLLNSWVVEESPSDNTKVLSAKELKDLNSSVIMFLEKTKTIKSKESIMKKTAKFLDELKTVFDNEIIRLAEKAKTLEKEQPKKEAIKTNTAKGSVVEEVALRDAIDSQEVKEAELTITPQTQLNFTTEINQGQNQPQTPIETRFVQAGAIYAKTTKDVYRANESDFNNEIDKVLSFLTKSKKPIFIELKEWYYKWENYIKQNVRGRKIYNHLGSSVSKVVLQRFYNLFQEIMNDKTRADKNPTVEELEKIIENVNEAIFGSLHYVDDELRVNINITPENQDGFLYTRAMHWFLRDLGKQKKWDKKTIKKFNFDTRGEAYRRLINSIINFNQKNGAGELEKAVRFFVLKTDVEPIVDLSLDKVPHTSETARKQWQENTDEINNISKIIGYKAEVNNLIDAFTAAEILGMFNKNSWSQVLVDKIVEGIGNQIEIIKIYKKYFDENKWLNKNYRNITRLDKNKNAVEIKSLGGIKIRKSQIIYFRNVLARELVRNKAIDEGIIKGIKTHHFEKDFVVRILNLAEDTVSKLNPYKRIDVKIDDANALLNELDSVIENDAFMKEYNEKTLKLFSLLYPYINERYKEINGLNLRNDGKEIRENLIAVSDEEVSDFFGGFPESINSTTVVDLYVPFLLDSSAYFKKEKVDFKEILDFGVFDGMTQELSDSTASVNIESITNVLGSFAQEVANYFGLHRVMRDLNVVLNEKLDTNSGQVKYVSGNISLKTINFFKDLLLDSAGYKIGKRDPLIQKTLRFVRRNFYRAALAANIKVIFTQFATFLNLSNIYGDNFIGFSEKMLKNLFAQLTAKNKQKITSMTEKNNIFWDRSFNSTFEIGQATKEGKFAGESGFTRIMEKLMVGIIFTDNAINKAFYLTLLETINPNTGQNFTEEEAGKMLEVAILRSQSSALDVSKSALLRTDSDLVMIFLKFLGEPMKHITQLFSSAKQIELIKKIAKHKNEIISYYDNEAQKEAQKLQEAIKTHEELIKKEESEDFVSLPEKEQKEIHQKTTEAKKEADKQAAIAEKALITSKKIANQVEGTIASAPMAKNLAKRRATAFVMSILYLTALGVAFGLIRSKMGKTDKEEEETFLKYLAKKTGVAFADELFGMFPFVRDVYQLLSKGFNFDEINILGSANDLVSSLGYMMKAVIGGDANWPKHIRQSLLSAGQVIGIPTRSLERIFTTVLLYASEDTHYRYKVLIGSRNRDNIELAKAIKSGDEKMISAIIERKIQEREIRVSNPVINELKRLAKENKEVSITGINEDFTQDGTKYVMTKKQQQRFAQIYNKADLIVLRIIKNSKYNRLDNNMKKRLLQAVYNYYYRLAKNEILKELAPGEDFDLIPDDKNFKTLAKTLNYFLEQAEKLYKEQKTSEYKKEQREKERREKNAN